MTTNSSLQDWARVLNLARKNAADEMSASQDLLGLVDILLTLTDKKDIKYEELIPIRDELIKTALKLSHQSKELSIAVSKLVGVI